MSSNGGFIKLHRELLESRLWSFSEATLKVAIYLVLSANHKRGWWRGVELERGQCVRSLDRISKDCKLTRKTVRSSLRRLEEAEFILRDSPFGAHQGHRLTICNYDVYQDDLTQEGTRRAREVSREVSREVTPNKNEKKNKKNKNTPSSPPGDGVSEGADSEGFQLLRQRPEMSTLSFEAYLVAMRRAGLWRDPRETRAARAAAEEIVLVGQLRWTGPGKWLAEFLCTWAAQNDPMSAGTGNGGLVYFPKKRGARPEDDEPEDVKMQIRLRRAMLEKSRREWAEQKARKEAGQ